MRKVPLFYIRIRVKDRWDVDTDFDLGGYYAAIQRARSLKNRSPYLMLEVTPIYVYDLVDDDTFAKKYLPYELDIPWDEPGQTWISLEEHLKGGV